LNTHADQIMDFIPANQHENVQHALLLLRDALLEANTIEVIASNCLVESD
jgi:hypothetical protein